LNPPCAIYVQAVTTIIALRRRKIANGAIVSLDLPNLFEVANERQTQTSRAFCKRLVSELRR
jgi:hypothetical protein